MDENGRKLAKDDRIYDLVDVVEEGPEEVLPVDIQDDKITGVV